MSEMQCWPCMHRHAWPGSSGVSRFARPRVPRFEQLNLWQCAYSRQLHQKAVAAASPELEQASIEDSERLVAKAANLVSTSNLLVPYDEGSVNLALVIWQAIKAVPQDRRHELLRRLNNSAIEKLWRVTAQRYIAPASLITSAIGPEYSVWMDLPDVPEKVVDFAGRAALVVGLHRFSLSFFLHPDTEDPYARLAVLGGPLLGDLLWPVYCRALVGQGMVPGTEELCDVTLRFAPPERLGLTPGDLPRSAWPRPRTPLPPFDRGFTGYVRAAGPGVYVGKAVQTEAVDPEEPLYFVLAWRREDVLRADQE